VELNPRERAELFRLIVNPLPPPARGRLLLDKEFYSQFDIAPKSWFPLGKEAEVEVKSLHNALRAAVSKRKSAAVELRNGQRARVKLELGKAGQAIVKLAQKKFAFSDADLLSCDKTTRMKALRRVFAQRPLDVPEQDRWYEIASKRSLEDDEFIALMMSLGATPEAVRDAFREPQELNSDKLMPDEPNYYRRLVGRLEGSSSLREYIEAELAKGREALFQRYPQQALLRLGFTALWQPLIPFELLSSLQVRDLTSLLQAEDPFSLLFGFELCCRRSGKDADLVELGEAFLKKLLLEPKKSLGRCNLFCACAMISVTNLRQAAKAANAPLFWVRLAALTHAGVLADALQRLQDTLSFLRWATENRLANYLWHGVIDRRDAPRWNPEWISPEHLYAELVGRAQGALQLVAEDARPASWVSAIEGALDQLKSSGTLAAAYFPGPFDDFSDTPPLSSGIPAFKEIEDELEKASHLGDVPELEVLGYSVQPSDEVLASVLRLLSGAVDRPLGGSLPELHLLRVCAHLAAATRNKPLADLLVNRCLFRLQGKERTEGPTDLFLIAAHACAAQAGEPQYRGMLETTAARFCFGIDGAEDLSNLDLVLEVLTIREEKLIPALARARAIVRTKLVA
jgi:hypothetical protein